ncbi:alpha-L-rhamnosidase C-terminal domain-containing protein [Paenibacillus sp. MBLB4367]|uniref:alpha-L-rhamnosidase-related protein n=1 Tax=Paenibacillus sp. MBLB4367 TaxID=3384767 RepID=UPI003908216D
MAKTGWRTPDWIWHPDGEKQREIVLVRRFTLEEEANDVKLWLAATGNAEISLNGVHAGAMAEQASGMAAYTDIRSFPRRLAAGHYELKIAARCERPVPVIEASMYLWNRTVGVNAFLQAGGLWLPTDEDWETDGVRAAVVCKYGEEPYGDLENSPDWFVKGGYGDIGTEPVAGLNVMSASGITASQQDGGLLRLSGTNRGQAALQAPAREEKHLFYHLRKQAEWKEMRTLQQERSWAGWPRLRIDLGKEYNARFKVHNAGDQACAVLWNGAESLEELDGYDSCITEWLAVEAGAAFVTLPQGMRYIELTIIGDQGTPFELGLAFESACVTVRQAGTFESDLPLLNDIYGVSVHTNRICHQLGLWDGVKRDRLNWTYDYYMAAKADYVLWDNLDVLKRSIRELGAGTPYGHWINGLETYTLWWINNLWEYYWFTADKAFLLEMKEDLQKHVRWVRANLDDDTGAFKGDGPYFLEWVPMRHEDSVLGFHALLRITLGNLRKLAAYVPELQIGTDWKLAEPDAAGYMQATALIVPLLGIASGYVSGKEAETFLRGYALEDPITPLSAFWLAECCSLHGLHDRAWEIVSTVWGDMLKQGATTFWESVRIQKHPDFHDALTTFTSYDSYRISLCHSWSSTPVQWISRFVLGVEPLEPGYAAFSCTPRAVTGASRFRGTVPTPNGDIEISWEVEETGSPVLRLQAPGACKRLDAKEVSLK